MAFERVARLYVGSFVNGNDAAKGYLIDGLDFDFEVFRSTSFYKDYAKFTIYNPSNETIAAIKERESTSVVFEAGYKDQFVGTIFVGQIAVFYTDISMRGDIELRLICNAQRGAQYELARTYMTLSFPIGSSYYDVLSSIADFTGVALSGASSLKEYFIEDVPYFDVGDIRSLVKNFVARKLRAIGGYVIISNNEMIYVDSNRKKISFESTLLNFDSGLISAKVMRDEKYQSSEKAFMENREYYIGLKSKPKSDKSKKSIPVKKNYVQFESILNPALKVAKSVTIDARVNGNDSFSINGEYLLEEITFSGSNYGNSFSAKGKASEI